MESKTGLFLYASLDDVEDEVTMYFAAVLIHGIAVETTRCSLSGLMLLDGVELDKRTEQMISQKLGVMLNESDFVITDPETATEIQKLFGKGLSDTNFTKLYAGSYADINFLHQDAIFNEFAYSGEGLAFFGKFPEILALITATCKVIEKKQLDLNFEAYDVFIAGEQKFGDFINSGTRNSDIVERREDECDGAV